jgi:hypothetical protein
VHCTFAEFIYSLAPAGAPVSALSTDFAKHIKRKHAHTKHSNTRNNIDNTPRFVIHVASGLQHATAQHDINATSLQKNSVSVSSATPD